LFAQKNQGANNDSDSDDGNVEILYDTVDYDRDEVIEILDTFTDQKFLKNVIALNKTVNNFRQVAKFVRKSTVSKEKLQRLQRVNGIQQSLSVDLDVKTRRNSKFHMLQKFIKLKKSIRIFFEIVLSSEGQREFRNKSLPSIEE